jgi:CBS domain-containing protein
MLLVGGAVGSAYGTLVSPLFPGAGLNANLCAIVAMSALFSAAARAPFTSFLFAYELTGDPHAIVPLMIGCMVADIVARLLTEHSVMTERLAQRGLEVPRTYEADVLTYLKVSALMKSDVRTVPADTPVRAVLAELQQAQESASGYSEQSDARRTHHWWVVVRPDGHYAGVVTRRQIVGAQVDAGMLDGPISKLARSNLIVAYPDEVMHNALVRMLQNDVPWLPVVDRADFRRIVGYVSRDDALAARQMRLQDEVLREGILRTGSFRRGAKLAREVENASTP